MEIKKKFELFLTLTFSKIMAFIILVMAFIIDMVYSKAGVVFQFAIPFVVFLITGRQYINMLKVGKSKQEG